MHVHAASLPGDAELRRPPLPSIVKTRRAVKPDWQPYSRQYTQVSLMPLVFCFSSPMQSNTQGSKGTSRLIGSANDVRKFHRLRFFSKRLVISGRFLMPCHASCILMLSTLLMSMQQAYTRILRRERSLSGALAGQERFLDS